MIGDFIQLAGVEYRKVARQEAVNGREYQMYVDVADAADAINNTLAPVIEAQETWLGLHSVSLDVECRNLRTMVYEDETISLEQAKAIGEQLNILFVYLERKQRELKND